jgi:hypothetical protein
MRVLASDNDGFEFERAFIGEVAGELTPVAIMGGVACNIDTKPDSLEYGLAFCQPLVARIARDWPINVVVDRGFGAELLWHFTADPRVVAAARRFADISSRGAASVGSVL